MAPRKKKDEPKDGHVILLNNKEYITHIGLLDLAHKAGMQGMDGEYVLALCNADKDRFVYKAKVWDSEGREFSAHGHGSPSNLNRKMVAFAAVMAETRAWNRAMRTMVNHGATTADEMMEVGLGSQPVASSKRVLTDEEAYSGYVNRPVEQSWWQPVQEQMLECPGQPTIAEIEEVCITWSKGKLHARDCTTERLVRLIAKLGSDDGQALLHDIREREAIKAEGASK